MKNARSSRKHRSAPHKARFLRSFLNVEQLENRITPSLSVGPLVNISQQPFNQEEATIVIDPTNPQRMFAASNNDATSMMGAFSTNGGATWTSRIMANGTDGLPRACCDPQAAWDSFGNLYLTYITMTPNFETIVLLSTNGGQSFTALPTIAVSGGTDQPSIAVGPDGTGAQSVWVYTFSRSGGLFATGARVTGLNQVGSFITPQLVPGTQLAPGGQFGDVAIGPNGQVLVTWIRLTSAEGSPPNTIHVNLDANGLAPGGFGNPIQVTTTNVGFRELVPAQPTRGFASEPNLAWDTSGGPRHGRVYMSYTEENVNGSDDTDIYLRFSDNNGLNWSNRVRVNDDPIGNNRSQLLPHIDVDEITGNVAVGWLDARNDNGVIGTGSRNTIPNDDVQAWGTVSIDGGLSFLANVQLSPGATSAALAMNTIELGDYNTLDFHNNVFFYVWADNSPELPNHTGNTHDIATARVTLGNISGTKFNDINGNGTRDSGEGPLPGWTIFLDQNDNGTFDANLATDTFTVTESPARPIPNLMTITSTQTVMGLSNVITDINVSLDITHTFDRDLNVVLISPQGERIRLFTAVGLAGDNFRMTVLDDEAATAIEAGVAPFTGMFRPQDALSRLDNINPNGTWTLEITDTGAADAGELNNWALIIQTGERSTITNTAGVYAFSSLPPATYTVREVVQNGWQQTAPATGSHTVNLTSSAQVFDNRNFGNRLVNPGTISGQKFHDLDGDGTLDAGEPGLPNWVIFIDTDNDGVLDAGERNTTTDTMGNYSFSMVTPGTYILREVVQSGWVQRTPLVGFHSVTLGGGESATGRDFGNFQRGSIAGQVFSDVNGNSTRDGSETGMAGATAFLDLNNDGVLNTTATLIASPDVPRAIPDAGMVTSNLVVTSLAGVVSDINVVVNISHTFDSNLEVTLISPAGTRVLLFSGVGGDGDDFAGTVLNDETGLSIRGALAPFAVAVRPEQLLSAVDGQNPNGVWQLEVRDTLSSDSGTLLSWSINFTIQEPSVVIDGTGNYTFPGLAPNTYVVRELPPTGFIQTFPRIGSHSVTLASNQNVTGRDFGNLETASITATKFLDANGNGVRETQELPLQGWTIFHDANNNGTWEGSLTVPPIASTDIPRAIPDATVVAGVVNPGMVTSTTTVSGLVGNITDLNVIVTLNHPVATNLAAFLISPAGTRVRLFATVGVVAGGTANVTTTLDDEAAIAIASGAFLNAVYRPMDLLAVLDGEMPNGDWRLEIQDNVPTNAGNLINWSLTFATGERAAITNAAGNATLGQLVPGTYIIREVEQTGFTRTTPTSGSHSVTLINGENATNLLFGNRRTMAGSISGRVFHDQNANAMLDTGEPGQENWVLFLDTDNDAVLDAGESFVGTDPMGNYTFGGLLPGTYTVRELVQAGWTRSLPVVGFYSVTLTDGQSVIDRNFGNYQAGSIAGSKFNDANGNGTQDADETGLAAWTLFLDANNNGTLDLNTGTAMGSSTTPLMTSDTMVVTSTLAITGVTGVITDINVTLNISHGRVSDLAVVLISPSGNAQLLFAGIGGTSGTDVMGTTLDDEAAAVISSVASPFTGTFRPLAPLTDFDNEDPNGTWILQITDAAPAMMTATTGTLNSWSINLTLGERSTVTNNVGDYLFGALRPGTYTVREVLQPGWSQTAPAGGSYSVTVANDQDVIDRDFGNRSGTISGAKFNDLNNNGTRDPGDPGLQGWTIFLDQNNNGTFDGSQATITAPDGLLLIPDFMTVTSDLAVSGLTGTITDVNVTLRLLHTFDGDLQAFLVSPTGTRVRLFMNVGGAGDNFLNTVFDDETDIRVQFGAAPFTGSFRPEQPLSTFDGQDPNGTWRLEISDVFAGDVGALTSWSLTFNTGERSTVTDAMGNYSFTGLAAGNFTVREVLQSGFTQTAPASGSHSVTLTTGQNTTGIDFGNRTGSISGVKFHDLNNSGTRDTGEPGLPGWTIFQDINNNGTLDSTTTTVNASSMLPLQIPDLNPVHATVLVSGLVGPITDLNVRVTFTHPIDAHLDVFLISPTGTRIELFTDIGGTGMNFTNTMLDDQASIPIGAGVAPFTDSIPGGTADPFRPEGLLAAVNGQNPNGTWRLEIIDDTPGPLNMMIPVLGTLDSWSLIITTSEPTAVTDATGTYNFTGLAAGTFTLREVTQSGWTQTAPAGGSHTVMLAAGETASGRNFGNRTPAASSISGNVFHDLNGNGVRDTGEPGLQGWTVYLDTNQINVNSTDTPLAIPDMNMVTSSLTIAGLAGDVIDVNVRLNISHTNDADLDVFLISPTGVRIELFSDVGGTGDNFTDTVLDDQAATSITAGTAPFTGTFRPASPLAFVNDLLPNGIWRLEITDDEAMNTGTLNSWSLTLRTSETELVFDPTSEYSAITDANGNYSFTGLPPATYNVRQVVMPGFTSDSPSQRFHQVVLAGGQSVTGRDFANYQPATVSGIVFNDENGNGTREPADEGLLPNWTVFLDQNNNGMLDTNLATQTFTSTDVPQPLRDFSAVLSILPVGGLPGVVTDVNVTINITHPQDNNLIGVLISPAGTAVQLFFGQGGAGDDYTNTTFDDEAATAITFGAAPHTGTFRAQLPLFDFDGETPNGSWRLLITDGLGMNTGTLNSWSITITTGERSTLSSFLDGSYTFVGVPPGTYTVREVLQTNWTQTTPPSGGHALTLTSNQTVMDRNFGNRTGSIEGTVFHDFNANGTRDTGEPGTGGWTVFLDANNNGVWDGSATTITSRNTPLGIPDTGMVTSFLEVSGLVGTLTDVNVLLTIAHTFDSDLQVFLVSPAGTRVLLFSNVDGAGDNFINTILNDEGLISIAIGVPPFTGTHRPEGSLSAFDGQNPNGTWRLELSDTFAGDVGILFNWALGITSGERSAVTDALGEYTFGIVGPGTYTVREVVQTGWVQTAPSTGSHTVTLTAGQMVMDRNFGNRLNQPGQVQFSAAAYTVNENAGTATITVTRTGGNLGAVSVQFATSNGTATAGQDYTATSGTLNFASGQTSATFTIPITDDMDVEGNETINLTLTSPTGGATLGTPTTAVLTIMDNDGGATTLRVNTFVTTNTGFVVTFNRPIVAADINLYDGQGPVVPLGPADVTVRNMAGDFINGSLFINPNNSTITWVRTGGLLDPSTYTVTLRSFANGFHDSMGSLLDGNADGMAGDDHVANFTVTSSSAVILSIPDVARGPMQPVDIPAGSATMVQDNDLPLRLSEGNNITSVTFTLLYNPALLTITGIVRGTNAPMSATVMVNTSTPGMALVTYTSPTALPAGSVEFARLLAVVPNDASYTSKHILDIDLSSIQINSGAIPGRDDDGFAVVAYFGDTTGNAGYSAADATRALRVGVGIDSGFSAFQLLDPLIIADIAPNGIINATDATRILSEAVALDQTQIPPVPDPLPPFMTGGPDPFLSFPRHFTGQAGDLITIPLTLDLSDGLEYGGLAISYDTARLELIPGGISKGSLLHDFDLFIAPVTEEDGTIRIAFSRMDGPINGRGSGSVVLFTFRIRKDAPSGGAWINLRESLGMARSWLNDGGLDLIPDPSDEVGDPLDGLILVTGPDKLPPAEKINATAPVQIFPALNRPSVRQQVATMVVTASDGASIGELLRFLHERNDNGDEQAKLARLRGTALIEPQRDRRGDPDFLAIVDAVFADAIGAAVEPIDLNDLLG